jgi:hypothetical protein
MRREHRDAFEISVNGEKLKHEFGATGKDWQWEKAGPVKVSGKAKIALHDLTGFDGRVDAIVLSDDAGFTPTTDMRKKDAWPARESAGDAGV